MIRPVFRVLLAGATGTVGRATLSALLGRGHAVTCVLRPGRGAGAALPVGAEAIEADVTRPDSLSAALRGRRMDAVVSCLATRSGAPEDAWAIEHRAQGHLLAVARQSGATQMVLLSAICVQKPRLAFQRAKLAFEAELRASGLRWTIVRPTALFKSLSGQVARVRDGKPFLVFGDGRLTACKPIADDDLAAFLADCLSDPARWDRVLPIGGPGDAITPLAQAEMLFDLLGCAPRIWRAPVALIAGIAATLGAAAHVVPAMASKAEFARIGHYYATESMLVWDAVAGRYDAAATPSFGSRTLRDHYAAILRGDAVAGLGEHAVF
jgi:divinyl chlorophyllide a 8-vinyl-reductase